MNHDIYRNSLSQHLDKWQKRQSRRLPDDWLQAALLLLRLDLEPLRPALLELYSPSPRCDHPRLYTDHTANWGFDSYREVYYFGHTFYQHIVNFGGHDLPVHLALGQASESDFTLSLKSLDRFTKACAENGLDISLSAAVYDSGHDGRGIYVRSESDPRLYPPIPRASPKFKELMKLRSGCERSNSVKKVAHKLERRPCRSETHYLVRLYLISIVEHAKAWLAEDRKTLGDDWKVLSDPGRIKQMAHQPSA